MQRLFEARLFLALVPIATDILRFYAYTCTRWMPYAQRCACDVPRIPSRSLTRRLNLFTRIWHASARDAYWPRSLREECALPCLFQAVGMEKRLLFEKRLLAPFCFLFLSLFTSSIVSFTLPGSCSLVTLYTARSFLHRFIHTQSFASTCANTSGKQLL